MTRRIAAVVTAAAVALGATALAAPAHAQARCTPKPEVNKGPHPGRPHDPDLRADDPTFNNWHVRVGSTSDPYVTYYYNDGYVSADGNGDPHVRFYMPFRYIIGAVEGRVTVTSNPANAVCVNRDQQDRDDPPPTRDLIP
ncbi:MAG TPA: hypothetical protein VM840_12425 [Actinomycetota bacterium]|nr:hypothetical protein [Actinomycetota bacterium]